MTITLTAVSSWAPWWELVDTGEPITVNVSFTGVGEFGLRAGPGGSPARWTTDRRTRTGRLSVTLPPTTGGVWRLGLYRRSGTATATVTVTPARKESTTSSTGEAMTLYRLTQQTGTLPAGTVVRRRGATLIAGAGLPIGGIFSAASEWKRDVTGAPVHERSAEMIPAWIARDLTPRYDGVAAFNAYTYNTAVYVVGPDVPESSVGFRDEQDKGYVPPQLYQPDRGAHFASVPILPGMIPAPGNDGHLAIWRPSTDQYWDFWRAKEDAVTTYSVGVAAADAGPDATLTTTPGLFPGWSAVWGGRLDGVSTAKGWFPAGMGTAASGLVTSAGSLGIAETRAGVIDHAISLAIYGPRRTVRSYPAQRTDGYVDDELALPEGIRLRLRPDADLARCTPIARMIGTAAKKYGFIVTDKAGAVNVACESGDPIAAATGVNPWDELRGGTPAYSIMRNFPWDQCEVLPLDYGKPS